MSKSELPDSAFDRTKTEKGAREEAHIHRCLRALFARQETPWRIVEAFGGVGNITRILIEAFPGVRVVSWDRDPRCVEALKELGVKAVLGDSVRDLTASEGDGVCLDHNMLTLLRLRGELQPLIERVLSAEPLWVQLNDSAVSKLHLNWKSYGAKSKSLQDYLGAYDREFARFGYKVTDHEGHARATQIILSRG